jgi:hypothetical protein
MAQALPPWLPGSTVVGVAGPQSSPMNISAMMLDNFSTTTTVSEDGNTVAFKSGSMSMMGMWMMTWSNIALDRDPIVSFAGGFKNLNTMMAMDFVFSITTPVLPLGSPTRHGGQTIVTLLDPGLTGPPLHLKTDSSGNPAYVGTIDGVGVLSMLTALNLNTDLSSASESQGYPGLTLPSGAVTSNIGILHRFSLTPGDQATFNSSFEVIPEPGTAALLGFSLLGLLAVGRRVRRR